MSKIEVLELLQSIFKYHYTTCDGNQYIDYNEVMISIDNKICDEKNKPSYFDCTLEEHQEALYG